MNRTPITPRKAGLLMVAMGTVALMGVPGVGYEPAPAGPITGKVRSETGEPIANAEVSLFKDDRRGLVEICHTDSMGRFAFRNSPERFHVFASADAEGRWHGSWALDRERTARTTLNLTLKSGRALTVEVQGPDHRPIQGAELRIFDADALDSAVRRCLTDELGSASVILPQRAHVAVVASANADPVWWMEESLIPQEGRLELLLPDLRTVQGRALDASGKPAAGILVSAWDVDGARWHGWTRTDPEGEYRLTAPHSEVRLSVPNLSVDPESGLGSVAAAEITFHPGSTSAGREAPSGNTD